MLLALALSMSLGSLAQEKPIMEIARDCETFAISSNNKIVCAVPQVKRIKKVVIQRADVWVASANGKDRMIVEAEKFMPVPPPQSYIVDSLAWSPDGSRIAMSMTTQKPAGEDEPASNTKAIVLLDDDGHEIKVEGLKTRFIEGAARATWLADNSTVVYLIGAGPYKIGRISTVTGQSTTLFEGHTFDTVVWDAAKNQAFVLSQNLNVQNRQAIFQLDLVHEGVREIARVDAYAGGLSLSPSGQKIAFFADGDAIEVRDLANPGKPTDVRAGMGVFGWSRDERRVLLKRGPPEKSGELIWVGLYDGSFVPALHGLEYHGFAIAPDGGSIAVTEPGREVLRVFPLQ
jgi:WD40 repeat protein